MPRSQAVMRLLAVVSSVVIVFAAPGSPASASAPSTLHQASGPQATVLAKKLVLGKVNGQSATLWKSNVPTTVRLKYSSYWDEWQGDIKVALYAQGSSSAMEDVDVEFALWRGGEQVDTETLYGFDWNPGGGPTVITLNTWDDLTPGKYMMYITTTLGYDYEGKQTLVLNVVR